jgi:hypothetical protein
MPSFTRRLAAAIASFALVTSALAGEPPVPRRVAVRELVSALSPACPTEAVRADASLRELCDLLRLLASEVRSAAADQLDPARFSVLPTGDAEAEYVVEGDVAEIGGRLVGNLRLKEVATGATLASGRLEGRRDLETVRASRATAAEVLLPLREAIGAEPNRDPGRVRLAIPIRVGAVLARGEEVNGLSPELDVGLGLRRAGLTAGVHARVFEARAREGVDAKVFGAGLQVALDLGKGEFNVPWIGASADATATTREGYAGVGTTRSYGGAVGLDAGFDRGRHENVAFGLVLSARLSRFVKEEEYTDGGVLAGSRELGVNLVTVSLAARVRL